MTFCCVVERELATSSCPLHRGACFWRHRDTGICMYDDDAKLLPPEDLAALVGAPLPTNEELSKILNGLAGSEIASPVESPVIFDRLRQSLMKKD